MINTEADLADHAEAFERTYSGITVRAAWASGYNFAKIEMAKKTANTANAEICPKCKGTGGYSTEGNMLNEAVCKKCNGTGKNRVAPDS